MSDQWSVVANSVGTKIYRKGAKLFCWRTGGNDERVHVVGISRGGRIVEKWEPMWTIENVRVGYVPPGWRHRFIVGFDEKSQVTSLANDVAQCALSATMKRMKRLPTASPPSPDSPSPEVPATETPRTSPEGTR